MTKGGVHQVGGGGGRQVQIGGRAGGTHHCEPASLVA